MDPLRHLRHQLDELREHGLLRSPNTRTDAQERDETLVLCSNDYLGYAAEPLDDEKPHEASGAGASRLISGDASEHHRLERLLADWTGMPSALLFSSGYAANVGVISALVSSEDVIVSDALNHASIIDGCRLSRATVRVTPHRDLDAVRQTLKEHRDARCRLVVTDSYFSMDGHCADVASLRQLCDEYDAALMVDEAHALGVFGPDGRGVCARAGIEPDVLIGTLGKSVGMQGAFVASQEATCHWLWNRARSFVFSTAASPWLCARITERIEAMRREHTRQTRLLQLCQRFREQLAAHGIQCGDSEGPIVPIVIGDPDRAVALSTRLREERLFVQAIRPPTVPQGTSRLRITLQATLTDEQLQQAVRVLSKHLPV